MRKSINTHSQQVQEKDLSGYPLYPPNEDIYFKFMEEEDLDPEDPSQEKVVNTDSSIDEWNEKSFDDDVSGDDLDVPGSELDDAQEAIGSEDEENNYYSLGGDNHDDLEENREENL